MRSLRWRRGSASRASNSTRSCKPRSRTNGCRSACCAVALSRRLGRLLTLADLGFPFPTEAENDTIGLSLGADPLDVLLPMWRYELDRRPAS